MAVCRVEKNRDFTVMSNHHLRNVELSLKAKGLLSLMLSLPENWDYTINGLTSICHDGYDSISSGICELEDHGYVIRERVRNAKGQLGPVIYTILEQPRQPKGEKPIRENPVQADPVQGKPGQLNKDLSSKDKSNTDSSNQIDDTPMSAKEAYEEVLMEQIGMDILKEDPDIDQSRLEEIGELLTDVLCSGKKTFRIGRENLQAERVRQRFLKLNSMHITYVLDCMAESTKPIGNIRSYLLTALYNAPATMNSYYDNKQKHDCYGR